MSSASLLSRLGLACRRSCGVIAEVTTSLAAAGAPSCSYTSIASSAARTAGLATQSWRPWGMQHAGAAWAGLGLVAPLPGGGPQQQLQHWRGFGRRSLAPAYVVGLNNLRDNPGATRQRIRVGRGNSGRGGKYAGRGLNGQNSRGSGLHMLYDGGQLGLLKFPVTRQRPSYEVLYYHLGLSRVVEFVQLGLLDPARTITMKDLYDSGCVTSNIKYGVLLYGKSRLAFPLDVQVTACDADTRGCVEAAGGRVARVYYTREGLGAVMHPEKYTSRRMPLPLPAARWHPKYDKKFDAIGQIPPVVRPVAALVLPVAAAPAAAGGAVASAKA